MGIQVHQLQHELSKKDELLRIVANATEENETDSSVSPSTQPPTAPGPTTAAAALSQLEFLRNKLQDLEEENLALRSEVRLDDGRGAKRKMRGHCDSVRVTPFPKVSVQKYCENDEMKVFSAGMPTEERHHHV